MISKEIKVSPTSMKVEIEITQEPKVILIAEGKAKEVTMHPFGEFQAITHQGKITDWKITEKGRGI